MSTPGAEDRLAVNAFPIPMRTHVHADNLTNALNDLINQINAVFLSLGVSPAGGYVTMKQLRLAMQNQANLVTYDELNAASVESTANVYWNHSNTTTPFDPLYTDIQTQLGMTAPQIAALYALAQTFPP